MHETMDREYEQYKFHNDDDFTRSAPLLHTGVHFSLKLSEN
jgi:hypothetical protein